MKKLFLKILQYSHKNNKYTGVFFNKDTGLKACRFMIKRLQDSFFPVNIAKFLF